MKILNIIILCLLAIIVFTTIEGNTITVDGFSGMKTTYAGPIQKYTPITTQQPTPTITYTPIQTQQPTPTITHSPIPVYSYDNIEIDHKIELCQPIPTHIAQKSELEYWYTNCGITTFVLNNYPLDELPSGGDSGIISDSEMVVVKITINGGISLIPWESVNVKTRWYDANEYNDYTNDNRLMYSNLDQTANSFNNEVTSYIGHFSWEIDEPGQYYIDVITEYGDARLVFDVI